MASVELCPKCHNSIAPTSYELSFEKDSARGYQNPTQSEVACIKSNLVDLSSKIGNLEREIKRVEAMLDALKAHHAHLATFIQRSTQYILSSPIRQLPTEVLGIVFASACTSFQRREYKTPLSISLVCSKWRDIALSTPSLWTHIYIAPHSDGLDLYNHFLERCGNIPIFVKVEVPYRRRPSKSDRNKYLSYEDTRDYHVELISATFKDHAQWKVAELYMNQADVNLLASHSAIPEFPDLESLTLVSVGPADYLRADLFNRASSLTSFTVMDVREDKLVEFDCYIDSVPWHQLREVCTQSDVDSLACLDNEMKEGRNRTLVLRPQSHCLNPPLFDQSPRSVRVSTLQLDSVIWSDSLAEFFSSITIPTLQNLVMMPPDPSTIWRGFKWSNPFPALLDFLDHSGCTLQTFTIIMRGRYTEPISTVFADWEKRLADGLMTTLRSMTKLRALRLIEAESGPLLLDERLFQEMTEGHLLPELTSLEMVWAEERQPQDTLLPMLTSRCGRGGAGTDTISSVVLGVRNGGDLQDDVLDCMAGLRQRGIRATVW